jgi:MFS family permease
MSDVAEPSRLDRAYQAIFNEEDARVCTEISDEACHFVPYNFFRIVASQTLTSLGDQLINPKTVLTWLLGLMGAPPSLAGLLVPIRESGSMMPQLLIAGFIRRMARRKFAWVVGGLFQAMAVLGMAATAAFATGAVAGWLIVLLLTVFSLSRGLCSVASKDVLGKTIPKRRRGRVSGFGTAAAGLAAGVLGVWMLTVDGSAGSLGFYVALLATGGVLWIIASGIYLTVQELPGETEGGANGIFEAIRRLDLLRTDGVFRKFVIARALFLCSALSAPYFVILAQQKHGIDLGSLGLFILASALASSLSATLWGAMADVSSRKVLLSAGVMAAIIGLLVFAAATLDTPLKDSAWTYTVAFFLLGTAHSGVRLGRKTYLVDMAGGNRRTDYVAVSNTVIGVILLMTGLFALLASAVGPAGIVLILSIFGLIGVVVGSTLPEVE